MDPHASLPWLEESVAGAHPSSAEGCGGAFGGEGWRRQGRDTRLRARVGHGLCGASFLRRCTGKAAFDGQPQPLICPRTSGTCLMFLPGFEYRAVFL
jgi:hypothetical protein